MPVRQHKCAPFTSPVPAHAVTLTALVAVARCLPRRRAATYRRGSLLLFYASPDVSAAAMLLPPPTRDYSVAAA
jgi:hypothetical protein